jgi:hypothetical protein
METYKHQKYFVGDMVRIISNHYRSHHSHRAFITKTMFLNPIKEGRARSVFYTVRCGCGPQFNLQSWGIDIIPEPDGLIPEQRMLHFLARLGIEKDDQLSIMPVKTLMSSTKWMNVLTEKQKDILIRRFGLHGIGSETLGFIASEYNITRERVRQIEEVAINVLIDSLQIREHYENRVKASA